MTIEQYARAIAEAAIRHTTRVLDVDWIYGSDTIDAVIASVPAPDVQALRGQIEGEVWEARKRVEAALSAEIVELRAQIDAAKQEERPTHACDHAAGYCVGFRCEPCNEPDNDYLPLTPDVQAQSMGHDAETFRRGWMAGQADALKQIDAARADEREGWLELLERLEVYAAQYNEGGIRKHNRSPRLARGPLFDAMKRICAEIRARSGARG